MTREEIAARSLAMARDPDSWPNWPQLPLKRGTGAGWPEMARLVHTSLRDDEVPPYIYPGTMFDPIVKKDRIYFGTLEAIFAAGWEVD